jgi:hypothetical protein
MKSEPPGAPPGLPPSVASLLTDERELEPQPEAVRERLMARAHAAVRLGPPEPHALRPARPRLDGKGYASVAAGVVIVGGIVAAIHGFRGREPSAISTVTPIVVTLPGASPAAPPTASSAAPSTAAPEAAAAANSEPSASATDAGASNARPAPANSGGSGSFELELLTRARQADLHGDFAETLALVRQHEQRFPAGRLSEEREVLRVHALVGLGRTEPARRAAARFRRQFPHSVLLQRVDAMVPSAP